MSAIVVLFLDKLMNTVVSVLNTITIIIIGIIL